MKDISVGWNAQEHLSAALEDVRRAQRELLRDIEFYAHALLSSSGPITNYEADSMKLFAKRLTTATRIVESLEAMIVAVLNQ